MGSESSADLCGYCKKPLENSNLSIACDKCEIWHHDTCTGMTKTEVKVIKVSEAVLWFCHRCKEDGLKNASSNTRTNNNSNKLSQDDHNNSDNWRKLDVILSTLEANNARLNQIEKKLEINAAECTEKCNALSNRILEIYAKLDENVEMLRNEMSTALSEEGQLLRGAVSTTNCNSCDKLEDRLENMERLSFQRDLVLEGLPLMSGNNSKENLHEAVGRVCRYYGVTFEPQDISYCFRAGRNGKGYGTRPVIISFKSKSTRNALYFAYMKNRNLRLNDIVSNTQISSRIYITERITAKCKQLLRRCAALKKKNTIVKYYTRDGRLYIEKGPNSGAELVTSCLVGELENRN